MLYEFIFVPLAVYKWYGSWRMKFSFQLKTNHKIKVNVEPLAMPEQAISALCKD